MLVFQFIIVSGGLRALVALKHHKRPPTMYSSRRGFQPPGETEEGRGLDMHKLQRRDIHRDLHDLATQDFATQKAHQQNKASNLKKCDILKGQIDFKSSLPNPTGETSKLWICFAAAFALGISKSMI